MTGIESRPGAVSGAIWSLVIGAAMLAAGGLITAAVSFDTLRLVAPLRQLVIRILGICFPGVLLLLSGLHEALHGHDLFAVVHCCSLDFLWRIRIRRYVQTCFEMLLLLL